MDYLFFCSYNPFSWPATELKNLVKWSLSNKIRGIQNEIRDKQGAQYIM